MGQGSAGLFSDLKFDIWTVADKENASTSGSNSIKEVFTDTDLWL